MARLKSSHVIIPLICLVGSTVPSVAPAGDAPAGVSSEASASQAADAAIRAGHPEDALKLLERAANAGDPEAQYRLASLYRAGLGTRADDTLAFKWM